MSKSLGNYISIQESPENMFGKLMSVSDDLMWRYLNVLSFKSGEEIQKMKAAVEQGLNPRDIKIDFAKEIVVRFHDSAQAENAHRDFIERFQKRLIPEDLEELSIQCTQTIPLAQLLKQIQLTPSTSDAMRMIKQGAVKIDGDKASDPALLLPLGKSYIIQVGKRRIAKVLLQQEK